MTDHPGARVKAQWPSLPDWDNGWILDEAARLLSAERSHIPVVPLTARRPGLRNGEEC